MFPYDLKLISRDIMTWSAQRRMADLPAELQLQTMKAGVIQHSSMKKIAKVKNWKDEASSLFDGEYIKHLARDAYDAIQQAAEEAFLNTYSRSPWKMALITWKSFVDSVRRFSISYATSMFPPA